MTFSNGKLADDRYRNELKGTSIIDLQKIIFFLIFLYEFVLHFVNRYQTFFLVIHNQCSIKILISLQGY